MNTKKALTLILIVTASISGPAYAAEKFATYTTSDTTSIPRNENLKINTKSVVPAAPEKVSYPAAPTVAAKPALTSTIPAGQLPEITVPKANTLAITTTAKPKITVPSYEKQYESMLKQEEIRLKKRVTLVESIMNELNRYGMLIVLLLVLLIVFYAVKKDKRPETPHFTTKTPDLVPKKRDIWDEDF